LILVFGHLLGHRPGVARREVGRGDRTRDPAGLHAGDVLDQSADRQRADRWGRARLLVGEAVGDGRERVLLERDEVDEGLTLVACGCGQSGHVQFSFGVWV